MGCRWTTDNFSFEVRKPALAFLQFIFWTDEACKYITIMAKMNEVLTHFWTSSVYEANQTLMQNILNVNFSMFQKYSAVLTVVA